MTLGESLPTPHFRFLTGELWRTQPGLLGGVRQGGVWTAHVCVLSKETKLKTRRRGPRRRVPICVVGHPLRQRPGLGTWESA